MTTALQTLKRTAAVLSSVACLTLAVPAKAQGVIQPAVAKAITGISYNEASALWWQYALKSAASDPDNPLLSPTGKNCMAGQGSLGAVRFLTGYWGAGAATRTECTVPRDKALFFPMLNAFNVHVPGDGLDTAEILWDQLIGLVGTSPPIALYATVDGQPIHASPYALFACAGGGVGCAPDYSLSLPGNNIFIGSPAKIGRQGRPALQGGTYSPAVSWGYWVMLEPLPPGKHTITFGGIGYFGVDDTGQPALTSQSITYEVTVK